MSFKKTVLIALLLVLLIVSLIALLMGSIVEFGCRPEPLVTKLVPVKIAYKDSKGVPHNYYKIVIEGSNYLVVESLGYAGMISLDLIPLSLNGVTK